MCTQSAVYLLTRLKMRLHQCSTPTYCFKTSCQYESEVNKPICHINCDRNGCAEKNQISGRCRHPENADRRRVQWDVHHVTRCHVGIVKSDVLSLPVNMKVKSITNKRERNGCEEKNGILNFGEVPPKY